MVKQLALTMKEYDDRCRQRDRLRRKKSEAKVEEDSKRIYETISDTKQNIATINLDKAIAKWIDTHAKFYTSMKSLEEAIKAVDPTRKPMLSSCLNITKDYLEYTETRDHDQLVDIYKNYSDLIRQNTNFLSDISYLKSNLFNHDKLLESIV